MPLGEVHGAWASDRLRRASRATPTRVLNNGDALTWWDLQGELQGVPIDVAKPLPKSPAAAAGACIRTTPMSTR